MKWHFEAKIDYKELAIVVRRKSSEGYQLQWAYCNPDNLKEIVCTFSRVSDQAADRKLKVKKVTRKSGVKTINRE